MKGLTQKQKNIIEFINEFMTTQEMAPTIYEIAEHFHIKTSTVFAHIRALQKKSYLTRSSKARSISLSHPKKRTRFPAGVQSIPFHQVGGGNAAAADAGEKALVCAPINSMLFKGQPYILFILLPYNKYIMDTG